MKRERDVESPTRDRLERYISDNPGVSFNKLAAMFLMNSGTLRYHLEYLEGARRIKMVKRDNHRCYFPDYLATVLSQSSNGKELSPMEKRIAAIIADAPGITRRELMRSVDIRRTDLSRIIRKLKEKNLILESLRGSEPVFEPLTRERLCGEIMAVLVEKLLNNEIDMETFRAIKDRLSP